MKKELYESYFKGKKVTVLSLGLLGRGLGDTEFLLENGADVICTDTRSEEVLKDSVREITKNAWPNLLLILGENRLEDFEKRDFILTCTGLPRDYAPLVHALEKNIPVYMSAALVVKILYEKIRSVKVIGITGTRGKSTTTYLIHHMLTSVGRKAHLGGNVRGVANLPLLKDIEEGDYLVLELDSWQLQGFKDLGISPHVAVFTSFLDDHLNYYKGDRDVYFNDKAGIFINQKKGDVTIVSPQAHSELLKRGYGDDVIVPVVSARESPLIGAHNEVNVSLALEVMKVLGVSSEEAYKGLESFSVPEGRLQSLGEINGIYIYNDNNATTPDAVIAGIHGVAKAHGVKPIVICGGSDKGLDIRELERVLKEETKEVIYLSGTGTEKISLERRYEYEKLEDCFKKAVTLALPDDILLFAPGFASFSPYFKNEYERNDEFMRVVRELKEEEKKAV
jgi:UDP-N-acetylmuramoylalanine--D-glutamate ligase